MCFWNSWGYLIHSADWNIFNVPFTIYSTNCYQTAPLQRACGEWRRTRPLSPEDVLSSDQDRCKPNHAHTPKKLKLQLWCILQRGGTWGYEAYKRGFSLNPKDPQSFPREMMFQIRPNKRITMNQDQVFLVIAWINTCKGPVAEGGTVYFRKWKKSQCGELVLRNGVESKSQSLPDHVTDDHIYSVIYASSLQGKNC